MAHLAVLLQDARDVTREGDLAVDRLRGGEPCRALLRRYLTRAEGDEHRDGARHDHPGDQAIDRYMLHGPLPTEVTPWFLPVGLPGSTGPDSTSLLRPFNLLCDTHCDIAVGPAALVA